MLNMSTIAAALLLQEQPGLTPLQVTDMILDFATPDVVINPRLGSPNLLLYTGDVNITPTALAPSGRVYGRTPTFDWEPMPGATKYQVRVYQNGLLKHSVFADASVCNETVCSFAPGLKVGIEKPLYWQVRAKFGSYWGPYSAPLDFSVLSNGFTSTFDVNALRWTAVTGRWGVTPLGFYKSPGQVNAIASAIHKFNYPTLTYEARLKRKLGDAALPNRLHFRTQPQPLDSAGQWTNGYIFQYSNGSYFSVYSVTAGSFTPLVGWTYSSVINRYGWNTLKVVAKGGDMEFYINDTLVAFGHDETHAEGQVGISIWRGSDPRAPLLVDWVKVSSSAEPALFADPLAPAAGTGKPQMEWTDPNASPPPIGE